MSKGWHIERSENGLTLSRQKQARFDFAAESQFPPLRLLLLAQMIRQDMWRRLQRLRGYAPAVRVIRIPEGLNVTAGGSVAGRFPKAYVEAQVGGILQDSALRCRWIRDARLTEGKFLI